VTARVLSGALLAVVLAATGGCLNGDGARPVAPAQGYRLTFSEDGQLLPASRPVVDAIAAAASGATDVFVFSHGWWNSPATAECRYAQMIDGISARIRARRPENFRPVLVGIYWPSALFPPTKGDCDEASSEVPETATPDAFRERVREWAGTAFPSAALRPSFAAEAQRAAELLGREREGTRLSKTEADELVRIFIGWRGSGRHDAVPVELGEGMFEGDAPTVAERWRGPEARPGGESAGGTEGGGARRWVEWANVFTFWTMKDRAGVVGSRGLYNVVRRLQEHRRRGVRIHLIGHSFGGKLVTAAITGDRQGPPNTVDLQAAFSHFALSTTDEIRKLGIETSRPGLYARIMADGLVAGPVVVTYSLHDRANQFWYPRGVAVTNDFLEGTTVSKFGSLGADGMQGPAAATIVVGRESLSDRLGRAGRWSFNADASTVILGHSDLVKQEVFDLIWDAAIGARRWQRPGN
jgi:hypothetical protein